MIELLERLEFWHWWVLAAGLIAFEVIVPSTFFLWSGVAAVVVGLVLLAASDIGWQLQVLLFALLSVINVVAWRYYAKARPGRSDDPQLNRRAERYIGRQFTLEEPIVNGRGSINADGIIWKIEGKNFDAGIRVKIVGVDGVILKVEQD